MWESMWYRGSAGDEVKSRRTTGASRARSGTDVSSARKRLRLLIHTFTVASSPIYAGAHNHNIVTNCEAALAPDPLSLFVLDSAVCKYRRFVHHYSFLLKRPRIRELFLREEIPGRSIDDFIWRVTKYIDYRIRGIEESSVWREVCFQHVRSGVRVRA